MNGEAGIEPNLLRVLRQELATNTVVVKPPAPAPVDLCTPLPAAYNLVGVQPVGAESDVHA